MLEPFSNKIKICSRISLKFIYFIIYSILYFLFCLDSNVLFYISSILVSLSVMNSLYFYIVYSFLCLTARMNQFPFLPKKFPQKLGRRFICATIKSLKFKKLTKIGLLQILFPIFPVFFIFPNAQNYFCSK